jgi:V/A-type H+-transporting ATPase subunit A
MLKIGFLQQSAYDEVDSYSSPEKQIRLLKIFVDFHHQALSALRGGTSLGDIRSIPIIPNILRAKFDIKSEELDKLDKLKEETSQAFKALSTKPEVKAVA